MDNTQQETQPIGLNDRMKNMEQMMEQLFIKKGGKVKQFKLPGKVKRGWKSKLKKNYCLTIVIKNNCTLDFKMLEIMDDTIKIPFNDTYHIATVDYMLRYKQFPVYIIPEWNLVPFCPKKNLEEALNNDSLSLPEKVIITKIKQAQAGQLKKKMNGKMILWIGLLVVGGLYLLSNIMGGK